MSAVEWGSRSADTVPIAGSLLALMVAALGCSAAVPESANGPSRSSVEAAPAERDETLANKEASEKPNVACGQAPSAAEYEHLAGEAEDAFGACAQSVESALKLSRSAYLNEKEQPFPMGFGLEETVRKECLSPDGRLHAAFREAGVCSNIAMAMLVLRCVREQTEERCTLPEAIRSYYSSSADSEWHSMEGDALPPGVTTDRHGQRIPEEYKSIADFLSYLADHVDQGPYDPKRTEQMDPEQVSSHLSPRGVRFTDVNWSGPLTATNSRIGRELKAREGLTFVALTQLGWVYGRTAPHMSHLEFVPHDAGVQVTLPETYELFFERHDGTYRLAELRQLMESDL